METQSTSAGRQISQLFILVNRLITATDIKNKLLAIMHSLEVSPVYRGADVYDPETEDLLNNLNIALEASNKEVEGLKKSIANIEIASANIVQTPLGSNVDI